MKTIFAFLLFFITFMCCMIYLSGMHGHLMFRPHITEDWIICGIAIDSFSAGLYLLKNSLTKRTNSQEFYLSERFNPQT